MVCICNDIRYILSIGVMGATLRRHECGRCIYFQCPANCVPEDLKGYPGTAEPVKLIPKN